MDKSGTGPKRIRIGQRRFAYLESEVEAYIDHLIQARYDT